MTARLGKGLVAAALALGAFQAARAEDGRRLGDDVCVRLAVRGRASDAPMARVRVRNRGRNDQSGVLVVLRAGSESGDVLAQWLLDLPAGRSSTTRLRVAPPAGTTALVATVSLDGVADQDPSDNVATVFLLPSSLPGTPGAPSDAALGAAIYAASCASCHGSAAQGSRLAPRIAYTGAGEISEAIREGEDGMPTFPGLTAADVRLLAAFLQAPATPPPPPPPPPPAGTPPTYAGQVKALLDANCGACHSGRAAAMGLRFDTYAQASANAAAGLAAVQAGRMPKTGPLAPEGVQLLADWVAGGKQP